MRFGVLGRAFLFLTGLAAAQWPDRGGYRYLDSDTAAGPAFRWLDISGSGVRLDLSDDDNQGPFALGFRFRFYGREYDSVRVCSNGWLSFTSSSHQFHHYPIPLPDDPNALVAPLWLDLDPAQGGAVYYWVDTVQSRFVVSWENVAMHDTTDSCTFQVILDTSGTILFQYLRLPWEMRVGGYPSTAGIEDDSGLVGSQYLYDGQPSGHLLHDSLAIRFFQFDHDVSAEAILRPYCPELAEDSVVPLVRVWNAGLTAESFPVTLEIGPRYRQTLSVVGLGSLLDTVLRFPVWVPAEETCRVLAWTGLAGDEFPLSDSVLGTAVGSYQGQLRFDDGHADTWFIRVGAPNADWAAAVRFRSPYPSCRLRGALAWVDDTLPFALVLACPDSSGLPMLSRPYFEAESVRAGEPESWLAVEADTAVAAQALWLVAFWPRRATGPRIGEDRSAPVYGASWFGSPTVRWFQYADGDLMMRLPVDGRLGVEECPAPEARRCPPSVTVVRGMLRTASSRQHPACRTELLDISGRKVMALRPGGNDVRHLAAGVYFVRGEGPRGQGFEGSSRKVVIQN